MKKKIIPIVGALLASTSTYSLPNISLAEEVSDVIVVTANRRPQPLSEVGSSISVVTGEDLERNQQSFVLDALESLPGVSISQNGSFGGTAFVSIRGAGSNNTVLMVDGIQLNDASSPGGAFNFSTLDTYNIDQIEVLRGPQSVLYGSDATGGVINIITKTGGDGLGGKIFAEGGSFNTQRGGATLHGGTEKLGFNISASGINTDGISAADENDGNTERDGLSSYTVTGKLTSNLTDTFKLEALSTYTDSTSHYDNSFPTLSDGSGVHTSETEQFFGALRSNLELLDGKFQNTFSAEYAEIDRVLTSDFGPYEAKGRRTNFDYLGVYTVDENWVVTGGLQHETVKTTGESDISFDLSSFFGEIGFTGIDGLTLTAGGRYDDHETFGGATTFRVTGSYEFDETGTQIIANVGEGFKAPSISQLTFQCLTCDDLNEDLKPERSIGYEIGVRQAIWEDRVNFGITYFYHKIEDKITYLSFSEGYTNLDSTDSKGVEISFDAQLTDQLRVNGSYTYTDPKDRTTGDLLIREPKNLFSGSIIWMPVDRVTTTLNIVHNGQELNSNSTTFNPSWTRVDLRTSYEVMDDLFVYGRVDNLFNEEYQHVQGYGTPDRSYFAGIRKNF